MQTRLHSAVLTVVCLWFVTSIASAQTTRPYRGTTQSTRNIILRIENRSGTFRSELDAWISRNQSDTYSAAADEDINLFVRDFDDSVRRLHDRFDRRQSTTADVQDVLNRASRIDVFLRRHNIDAATQNEWSRMRVDLNQLANAYRVRWQQSTAAYRPYRNTPSTNQSYGPMASRLTGTYRLDISRSDDARTAADRAARDLAPSERMRVLDSLTRRLEAPEQLALDIRGQSVTIASTRAAQITFVADGRDRTEINSRGRTIRSRAIVNSGELMVTTNGDTGNDFSVTFDALDNGQRLNVTRRVYVQGLTNPAIVRSFYEKTSEVAQFDIYDPHNAQTSSANFIVPDGTRVVATLDDRLSTQTAVVGDRFTLRVNDPPEFAGATIDGHVSHLERSGRVTGRSVMTLDFDNIRTRDGRTYRFAGGIETVRTATGETVRVDEGTVLDENQTRKTEERAAIGTAVGAIIGAIAGGGRGAAVGAILGAGGGAGSVYAQGRNDLELGRGTELTIRSGAPRDMAPR